MKQSLISQIQRSKDVTLLSWVSKLEKKPKFYEPKAPKKFEEEEDFKISEDAEESKIPTFFNNKKNPETKLKKTAPEFHPKVA